LFGCGVNGAGGCELAAFETACRTLKTSDHQKNTRLDQAQLGNLEQPAPGKKKTIHAQ
jgi:hypothetical protein